MNPEIKKKWIEALESGEYTQGQGYLKRRGLDDGVVRHCCLGVLCEILNSPWIEDEDGVFVTGKDEEAYLLPTEIQNRVGIRDIGELMRMNDSGYFFPKIAKYIKENF